MKKYSFFIVFGIMSFSTLAFSAEINVLESVLKNGCDLQTAIDIAVKNNPELTAMALELDATDGRIIQAGLWPNPIFAAEFENFSGDNPGFNRAENTFSVTQPLLLGGKINLQKKLEELERLILKYNYEAKKIALVTDVEHAVYHILVTQKNLDFAKETRDTARKLYDFTKANKIKNDSDHSRYEILSAQIGLSQAELEISNVERNLEVARKTLAILCGEPNGPPGKVTGSIDREFNIPEYNVLRECLSENNFKVKAAEEYEKKAAILLKMANAERIPDLDLGFGIRQFEEDNSYTLVAGLSFPLPLFNRNQGTIQEAQVNIQKVEVDKKSLLHNLLLQLNEFYKEYQISQEHVTSYKNSILPHVQEYFDLTVSRYKKGSLEYLDVLVAERKLIEIKKEYTESLHKLQNSVAHLERLCSKHFHGSNGEVF